jgi:predicted nucleic acid-binding protein
VDTFALIALAVKSDTWHERARDAYSRLTADRTPLLTSDWVLTEFLNAASRSPSLRTASVNIVRRLQASTRVSIVPADREGWLRAFELFGSREDKGWSLVDCSSILLCRERGVTRVLTHDHHFRQAGLELLLR